MAIPWIDLDEITVNAHCFRRALGVTNPEKELEYRARGGLESYVANFEKIDANFEKVIVDKGFLPQGDMEFLGVIMGGSPDIGYLRTIEKLPRESYFTSLDSTTDLVEYLRLLRAYPLFGIDLMPYVRNYSMTYPVRTSSPQKGYAQYVPKYAIAEAVNPGYNAATNVAYKERIRRFAEIVTFEYLDMTFTLLSATKIDDLPTLLKIYDYLLNIREDIVAKIVSPLRTKSILKDIIHIGYKDEVLSVFQAADYGSPHYAWAREPAADEEARDLYIPQNIPDGGGIWYNPQEVLIAQVNEAVSIIENNINKLEAKIVVLRAEAPLITGSRKAGVITVVSEPDPYSNPFLVYDPVLSRFRGVAVFQNIATNKLQEFKNVPPIEDASLPVSAFEQAMALRREHERSIEWEGYGAYSQADLKAMGVTDTSKTNLLPLVLIGGLAAYAVSQAL